VLAWGWTHVSMPTVPFNAQPAHLFRHFSPSFKKVGIFFTLSHRACWRFCHFGGARSGGFLPGLLYWQLFSFLVSRLLPFFRFLFLSCISSISVFLSCSRGVRKRGFFYFYSGRSRGEVECCIACRTVMLGF
jgi:hypothetical protein